jgi:hypothetical protein
MRKEDITPEYLANETLKDCEGHYRDAYLVVLELRGTDGRTKTFKHYNAVAKWMQAHWARELG